MIPVPLVLIGVPLLAAPVVYVLRRWAILAAALAIATCGALIALAWQSTSVGTLPLLRWTVLLGKPVFVMGRELAVDSLARLVMIFLSGMAAVAFLFAWRVSQGWSFFPLTLVILGVLNAVLVSRHFVFKMLLLEVAAALMVFIIQGGRQDSTRGALRYLVFVTLALPFFLVGAWLIEQQALAPEPGVGEAELQTALRLLIPGFALLLAAVPFHGWMVAVGADAPPVVGAFVLGGVYVVHLAVLLSYLQAYPWLGEEGPVYGLLGLAGLVMVLVGGGMALVQERFGRLVGYAALYDAGAVLMALGQPGATGMTTAVWLVMARAAALLLTGMGLSVGQRRGEGDDFARLQGVGKRTPVATVGLLLGGLALAGFPPTGAFVGRWTLVRLFLAEYPTWAWALLGGGVAVALGFVRGLAALVSGEPSPRVQREPVLAGMLILLLALVCVGMAVKAGWVVQVCNWVSLQVGK